MLGEDGNISHSHDTRLDTEKPAARATGTDTVVFVVCSHLPTDGDTLFFQSSPTHLQHGVKGLQVEEGEAGDEEEARDHAGDERRAGDDGLAGRTEGGCVLCVVIDR